MNPLINLVVAGSAEGTNDSYIGELPAGIVNLRNILHLTATNQRINRLPDLRGKTSFSVAIDSRESFTVPSSWFSEQAYNVPSSNFSESGGFFRLYDFRSKSESAFVRLENVSSFCKFLPRNNTRACTAVALPNCTEVEKICNLALVENGNCRFGRIKMFAEQNHPCFGSIILPPT